MAFEWVGEQRAGACIMVIETFCLSLVPGLISLLFFPVFPIWHKKDVLEKDIILLSPTPPTPFFMNECPFAFDLSLWIQTKHPECENDPNRSFSNSSFLFFFKDEGKISHLPLMHFWWEIGCGSAALPHKCLEYPFLTSLGTEYICYKNL